ncbi:MAG: glycosyltransferase [Pseudomonadota bacterium]
MTAPVTVVIPTLDAERGLPGAMASLVEGVEAGLIADLVVSDGGSLDATVAMAENAGARIVTGARGRGPQIGAGVAAARASWVLILHADTELRPGWTEAVVAHLGRPDAAGYFRLAFRAAGFWPRIVAGWANLRSHVFGLPYGDQGLLIHRDLLDEVGGVPSLPLMEDVALARALGRRLVALDAVATTSAERYERDGWVRRGARNLWTLARYLCGVPPAALVRSYDRSAGSRNCRR